MLVKDPHAGQVTFIYDEPSKAPVFLAGSFNQWSRTATPLRLVDGKWKVTIPLLPGEHQFRYLVGDRWQNDHKADKYVPNGQGTDNSVVVVEKGACKTSGAPAAASSCSAPAPAKAAPAAAAAKGPRRKEARA